MPRILGSSRNIIEVQDNLSGSILTMYYKMPTNSQRNAYGNAFFERKGNKVLAKADAFNIQARAGAELCTGFKAGDFVTADGQPIASDPAEPGYMANWRDLVMASASDVLAHMARTIYGSVEKASNLEFVLEDLSNPEEPDQDQPAQAPEMQDAATPATQAAPAPEAAQDPLS